MSFTIYITKNWDQLSQVAAELVAKDIREKQSLKDKYVLGLATGNSPTGLYKHLAKKFNSGEIDSSKVQSFNLDEYVGLPGENAQQRALHRESYSYFMIQELFALLQKKFIETNVPWGTLIDQTELRKALDIAKDDYEMQGADKGKAIVIKDTAQNEYLRWIKKEIIDAYWQKIDNAGGIDLHIVGVGGRGHVAFHESGIPFEGNKVLLVKLDDNTVKNAVEDGHFAKLEDSPWYAISMGAEQVYKAKSVLLVANGKRKTDPITEAILGPVTSEVPISYGQKFHKNGGNMIYVIDEVAATKILAQKSEVEAKGYSIIDTRGEEYITVESLTFKRNPDTDLLG